jgi:hypothetical protein
MQPGRLRAALLAAAVLVAWPGGVRAAETCSRDDFVAVVDEAAAALRELNLKNRPNFQERLRQLREKRGWSHDDFLREAAPFVRDDNITVFDRQSEEFLGKITSLGQEGGQARVPDCELLKALRGHMRALIEVQQAKWSYMFEKLGRALAQ